RLSGSVYGFRRQEKGQGLTVEYREALQIDGVDTTLAKFALGDERLRSRQRLRHLDLCEPSLPSRLTKAPQQVLVIGGVHRAAAALAVLHTRGARCTPFRDTPS